MGCAASVQGTESPKSNSSFQISYSKDETVLAALVRFDEEISSCEGSHPIQRLAVISAELRSIQIEIAEFEGVPFEVTDAKYAKTIHQMFVALDLYKRPMLAAENEDFVANVNRKEMRYLEAKYLRVRERDLERESQLLHTQLLRLKTLYTSLQMLIDSLWFKKSRPGLYIESALQRSQDLRNALASVSTRLRAASEYGQNGIRLVEAALRAWKLASIGRSGWERTSSCADACSLLIQARCQERGARRVLCARAAPRAARSVRLTLDYAFTDCLHDHKNQRAIETFIQFKENLEHLVSSIHKVMLSNMDNLLVAEKEVTEYRRQLRAARINDIVRNGLGELHYKKDVLKRLQMQINYMDA
ncbi:uncharacterized protein LOC123689935 [Pieris rapae]|uniref:uncharacterized protein LOC123689935 n=1 Tax=Pieris rapae TaxID=64459 RepID=UPI001E27F02B|nr:uncharacterized protein LOC123689935 [Pieris rapae]